MTCVKFPEYFKYKFFDLWQTYANENASAYNVTETHFRWFGCCVPFAHRWNTPPALALALCFMFSIATHTHPPTGLHRIHSRRTVDWKIDLWFYLCTHFFPSIVYFALTLDWKLEIDKCPCYWCIFVCILYCHSSCIELSECARAKLKCEYKLEIGIQRMCRHHSTE